MHILLKNSQRIIESRSCYNPMNDDALPSSGSNTEAQMFHRKLKHVTWWSQIFKLFVLDHKVENNNVGETDWEQRNNFVEVGQFHENNGFV